MEGPTVSPVVVEQPKSVIIHGHIPPVIIARQQPTNTLPETTQDTASTVSSLLSETAESSHRHAADGFPAHETDPTSRASEMLDEEEDDLQHLPSDEAEHGSDKTRSDTDSPPSSDNSRKDWSEPSAHERVEAVGSHLDADAVGPAAPTELNIDPENADEARAVSARLDFVQNTILAFENNEPMHSSGDEEPYQLSVRVARNRHDIEQQQEEVERVRDEMRSYTRMIIFAGLFVALGLSLWSSFEKVT